jgi:hypothetical protein
LQQIAERDIKPLSGKKSGIGNALQIQVCGRPLFHSHGLETVSKIRIIVETGEAYLPEWEDWGTLLTDGLKLWGAGMIYNLPILVIVFACLAISFVPAFALPALIDSSGRLPPDAGLLIFVPFLICMGATCLAAPLGIALSLLRSPAMAHLVAKGEFSAAFRVKEIWPILKAGIGPFLVVIVVNMMIGFVFTAVMQVLIFTIILSILYPLLLGLYIFLLTLYNYTFEALAYREALRRLSGA